MAGPRRGRRQARRRRTPPIVYTAIGASDAMGIGGSVPCLPFTDCPNGTGYVPRVARQLEADGHAVTLQELRDSGRRPEPVDSGGGQSGRSRHRGEHAGAGGAVCPCRRDPGDRLHRRQRRQHRGARQSIAARRDPPIPTRSSTAMSRISPPTTRRCVRTIRQRAPNARIIVLNVPNLSGLPYMTGRSLRDRRWIQRLAVGLRHGGR